MGSIGEWNWAIAVASARYNASIVEGIFSKWPNEDPESQPPVHEIIFCATNLAFATELYLKAACVACSGNLPPGGHRLLTIFNNIPKADRKKSFLNMMICSLKNMAVSATVRFGSS